MQQQYKED